MLIAEDRKANGVLYVVFAVSLFLANVKLLFPTFDLYGRVTKLRLHSLMGGPRLSANCLAMAINHLRHSQAQLAAVIALRDKMPVKKTRQLTPVPVIS